VIGMLLRSWFVFQRNSNRLLAPALADGDGRIPVIFARNGSA
jgi:hypothetical protein